MSSMALPPDMMAALGGGGAPAGPLPPDIQAGLGAPEPELPSVVDGTPGGGEEALTQAIDLIQEAIDAEADQEDVQVMLQCQAKLQGILAKNQQDADKALQGQTTPKATRKMAPGQGGY